MVVLNTFSGLFAVFLGITLLMLWLQYRNGKNNFAAEKELKRNIERLELMQEVNQYHAVNVQDLLDFALEKVIDLTESGIGYIYHYNEENQQFILNTWSKGVMASCAVAEPQSVYHLDKTGIWGEVVRQRRPIMVNDYPAPSDLKKGYPEGHVPLSRFLSVPVFDGDKIVAVVGVANKVLPYNQSDVLQLTLMIEGVWKIAARLKLEEQLIRASHDWQNTFDSISDSIALIDPEQRIIRCNLATSHVLGRDFADIINQPCWKLFHGTDAPIPDCPMSRAKHSLHSETATILHNDRWLEVTVDPQVSETGNLVGAVHIVRDVTDRVNLINSFKDVNELFALFMKHSPIYCFIKEVTATESRVLQASDNFIEITGLSPIDMIGKATHEIFPADFAAKVTADDRGVIEGQKTIRLEEELRGRNYITFKFPIQKLDGRKLLAGYTIDITDLKLAQSELKKQASLMNGVLENADSAVFSVDCSYCYTGFNSTHAKLMKDLYDADIQLGCSLIGYMAAEDAFIAQANMDRALAGEAFAVEADSGDAQRARTVFEISHNPIKNEDGCIIGVAVFARDISERRKSEESLREMQAQMMQNDKLATIGQLAAGVAHEINNPIGFVGSNMSTLARYIEKYNHYIELIEQEMRGLSFGMLPEKVQLMRQSLKLDYVMKDISVLVDENNEGIDRIKRIVQDLRTFSRADSSDIGCADLNSCMDSTINIVINEIKYAAELKREYGDVPKVACNAQQINQVFMNLLINAAHAIQDRGDSVGEIVVRSWSDQENIFVSVADTGSGIPQEKLGKVFDAFYTTKEIGKGTGLGLSISSEIIRKHGGEIAVTSEVGSGSTFTVRIPLTPPQKVNGGAQ